MTSRKATALALTAVVAAGCSGSDARAPDNGAAEAAATVAGAERVPSQRPRAVVADCSMRSGADFPGAFVDSRNLVLGPLVWVGAAAYTPPDVVRRFGGNKFMLLVANGHRVTLQLSRRTRRGAGLAYGPLPQGEIGVEDAHRAVTLQACRRGEPSGSSIDSLAVTFWSGFVVTRRPACVPVYAWIDDEPHPRRVVVRMGVRRCA
jgi:hypothetical protein